MHSWTTSRKKQDTLGHRRGLEKIFDMLLWVSLCARTGSRTLFGKQPLDARKLKKKLLRSSQNDTLNWTTMTLSPQRTPSTSPQIPVDCADTQKTQSCQRNYAESCPNEQAHTDAIAFVVGRLRHQFGLWCTNSISQNNPMLPSCVPHMHTPFVDSMLILMHVHRTLLRFLTTASHDPGIRATLPLCQNLLVPSPPTP